MPRERQRARFCDHHHQLIEIKEAREKGGRARERENTNKSSSMEWEGREHGGDIRYKKASTRPHHKSLKIYQNEEERYS